jgi:hypothetical protein
MLKVFEQIRLLYDRYCGRIQPILRHLYVIEVINRFRGRHKGFLFIVSIALWLVTLFTSYHWINDIESAVKAAMTLISVCVLILVTVANVTRRLAPSRRVNEEFFDRIIRMKKRAVFRPVVATSEADMIEVGQLENDAFYGPSRTSLEDRIHRITGWLSKMDGLGQFIYFDGELIGYSVIIPVSEAQADKFVNGYTIEWAFDVSVPMQVPSQLTLYGQAIYVDHRHHGNDSSLGVAQAAALHHLLCLMKRLSGILLKDDSSKAVWRLLQQTRILADEGTLPGRGFMKHLGFIRREKKTANNRPIWELNFSRPAARGTALSQSRRLIAESLGVADDQPPAYPTFKDRVELICIKCLGYAE